MENFTTVIVPTVLTASQAHASKQQPGSESVQHLHPRQRAFVQRMFGATKQEQLKTVNEPSALRSQAEPMVKISLRIRAITDTLNSPFEYEMTEAARVVL